MSTRHSNFLKFEDINYDYKEHHEDSEVFPKSFITKMKNSSHADTKYQEKQKKDLYSIKRTSMGK